MANSGHEHWVVVKRVFKYLRGTLEYSICYHGNISGDQQSVDAQGYVNSDWVGYVDRRRSNSGYVFDYWKRNELDEQVTS